MEEHAALIENKTRTLSERPKDKKILKFRWIFKTKLNTDNSIKYKTRLVVKGYDQEYGVDYNETYSSVVKYSTLRCLLAMTTKCNYDLDHLDIMTAFLNGNLKENIYMEQPKMFEKLGQQDKVCKLQKTLYGLKEDNHAWNEKLNSTLLSMKFQRSHADQSLYYRRETNESVVIIAAYIDDLLLVNNNKKLKEKVITELQLKFKLRNLSEPSKILGLRIRRDRIKGILTIDQEDYLKCIFKKFKMDTYTSIKMPINTNQTLSKDICPKEEEKKITMQKYPYRELLGSLMYAYQCIRLDIGYAITSLGSYAENPEKAHWGPR